MLARAVATVGGIGYLPLPGLWGAVAGLVVFYLTAGWSLPLRLVCLAGVFAVGVWAGSAFEKQTGEKDPSPAVIDEVFGMLVATFGLSFGALPAVVALAAFLFFDRIKLWPANVSQKLSGGWGIMVDDAIAGVYALVATWCFVEIGMPFLERLVI